MPFKDVIRKKFNLSVKIKNIACPKLFIHGNRDNVVPFKLGRKLFEAAPEPKEFYEIDGADHNDTYIIGGNEYFRVINQFLRKK